MTPRNGREGARSAAPNGWSPPTRVNLLKVEANGAGGGSLADYDVDGEILHGGIEHLFHIAGNTVNFVNEQHVAIVEIGKQRRKVARLFLWRGRGHAQVDSHFVGDNARKGGLAESRRAVKQHMVKGSPLCFAITCILRFFLDLFLTDIVVKGFFGGEISQKLSFPGQNQETPCGFQNPFRFLSFIFPLL